jgi:hypothetical protein
VKTSIEIVGDVCYYVQKEVVRVCGVGTFLENIAGDNRVDTGWLPRGCARYIRNGSARIYLFEFPMSQKIRLNFETFSTLLPSLHNYILFVVGENEGNSFIGRVYFFTTRWPIRDLTDNQVVYKPLVPNLHSDGRVCTGAQRLRSKTVEGKVEEMVEQIINGVWNTDLLSDMSPVILSAYRAKVGRVERRVNNLYDKYSLMTRELPSDDPKLKAIRNLVDKQDLKLAKVKSYEFLIGYILKQAQRRWDRAFGGRDSTRIEDPEREAEFTEILVQIDTAKDFFNRIIKDKE